MLNVKEMELKVIEGCDITFSEAFELIKTDNIEDLFNSANVIRDNFCSNKAELCTIMNAKSGQCSEDCKYCAQSVYHTTNIKVYPLVNKEEIFKIAYENMQKGAARFSLVTSGKGLEGKDFEKILNIYRYLKEKLSIKLCASHGILSYDKILMLKQAGVSRYHHNIETSKNYYKNICSTHTYEDRINTIKNAQNAKIEVCSGGIIGLGESIEDRLNMAFQLKDLNIKSIPINILSPVKGTPLEKTSPMNPIDILKTISIFRFINKDAYIRYAGGRHNLKNMQDKGLKAGINSALTGDYLTTTGSSILKDIEMFINNSFRL